MSRAVRAFNALTGHSISESDGWLFMVALKAARATTVKAPDAFDLDDYRDGAAYVALWAECEAQYRTEIKDIVSKMPGMRIVEVPPNGDNER